MKVLSSLGLLALVQAAYAHGGHADDHVEGETIQQYAQRHMAKEHHIDTFDTRSFFSLHDLNSDGKWDREEIEAVYGVHHVYSQRKSKDDIEHQAKADAIVNKILEIVDRNKDGSISPEELETAGLDALPNFEAMGAEGHHYDVESEFFLHHEEEYHSTPETQTDESYTHPEDLEHFGHHEAIERLEAEREAKFQGISVEEALAQHDEPIIDETAQQQKPLVAEQKPPKVNRVVPPEQQDPAERFRDLKANTPGEWGEGEDGYKSPVNPADRLKKNLPYKYKFKRNWGDF